MGKKADREAEERDRLQPDSATVRLKRKGYDLVTRLASARKVTPAALFEHQDVEDFFTHLLLEELQKEVEQLKGPKKR